MAARAAIPDALEWASPFRAGMGAYDRTFAELHRLNPEGATRWRVAKLKAESSLSDGYFDDYEKWDERADRIEAQVRERTY